MCQGDRALLNKQRLYQDACCKQSLQGIGPIFGLFLYFLLNLFVMLNIPSTPQGYQC
jgi:hypothetical protein